MNIINKPSPNFNDRKGHVPSILVIHYTGMKYEEDAIERLCDPKAEVSAHFTITQKGDVYQHVDLNQRAWHAGKSFWQGEVDINSHSIGVELVNKGHEFGYEDFSEAQITALLELYKMLREQYHIKHILAHSDISPARKEDPGEKFPWEVLAKQGFGVWPDIRQKAPADFNVIKSLGSIGYDLSDPNAALIAFQRRYAPEVFLDNTQGQKTELTVQRLNGLLDKS